jgi:hypothetical protein
MAIKYTHFSNLMPSKIDPNWDFWFENKPSGKPGAGPHDTVRNSTFDMTDFVFVLPATIILKHKATLAYPFTTFEWKFSGRKL